MRFATDDGVVLRPLSITPNGTRMLCQERREPPGPSGQNVWLTTIRDARAGALRCELQTDVAIAAGWFFEHASMLVAESYAGPLVFDTSDGRLLHAIDVDRVHMWPLITPDQTRVLTCAVDGYVTVYDPSTRCRIVRFRFGSIPAMLENGTLVNVGTDRFVRFLRPSGRARERANDGNGR